jgi:hypothetical protein
VESPRREQARLWESQTIKIIKITLRGHKTRTKTLTKTTTRTTAKDRGQASKEVKDRGTQTITKMITTDTTIMKGQDIEWEDDLS